MVFVDVALALICFAASPAEERVCHHALVGPDTPKGSYQLQQRLVNDPLYGGDVLQFREDPKEVFAIHRVWLGRPAERRAERLKSSKVSDRRVTMGCINVSPEVYQQLLDCCSNSNLVIQ